MLSLPPELLFFPLLAFFYFECRFLSSVFHFCLPFTSVITRNHYWGIWIYFSKICFGICRSSILELVIWYENRETFVSVVSEKSRSVKKRLTLCSWLSDLCKSTQFTLESEIDQISQSTTSLTQIMPTICNCSPYIVYVFQMVPALGVKCHCGISNHWLDSLCSKKKSMLYSTELFNLWTSPRCHLHADFVDKRNVLLCLWETRPNPDVGRLQTTRMHVNIRCHYRGVIELSVILISIAYHILSVAIILHSPK